MFMLNSTEYVSKVSKFMKFIMLINVKMPTIVCFLTFISMTNTSENLKA